MNDRIRQSYDANAELYASLFLHDIDEDEQSKRALAEFASLAARRPGPIVDLGCGPGGVTRHLHDLGLPAVGLDLSPGQVAQARKAFPDLDFRVGDLTRLDAVDSSLGGIVARHSLIHVPPSDLDQIFEEWARALKPGAPVFLSFFGSRSPADHGKPFDHKVVTAYELCPNVVETALRAAGFGQVAIEAIPIPEGGRPFDHATVTAQLQQRPSVP